MGSDKLVKILVPATAALLAVLLFAGACSEDPGRGSGAIDTQTPAAEMERGEGTASPPTTGGEATGEAPPPEVTLDEGPGGRPEAVIRLEGDPETIFSGLCSVGEAERDVLSGRVPKRFTFDLKGRRLSCRIEKRDNGNGDLRVVLVAGDATRSVQQTNSPDDVIRLSLGGG